MGAEQISQIAPMGQNVRSSSMWTVNGAQHPAAGLCCCCLGFFKPLFDFCTTTRSLNCKTPGAINGRDKLCPCCCLIP